MPELPLWFEVGSFVVLGIVLLVDLLMVLKRPHEPSMKEAGLWVGFYVTLALVFAGLMFAFTGAEYGSQFVAGWVTEYSLSIDNLFVFIIIMARFSVPGSTSRKPSWWASSSRSSCVASSSCWAP